MGGSGARMGRATRSARWWAVAAGVALLASAGPVAQAGAAAQTLSVSPATGLVDGQVVQVEAGGLADPASTLLAECRVGGTDLDACGLVNDVDVSVGPDTLTGKISVAASYRPFGAVDPLAEAEVDCRAQACELVAFVPGTGDGDAVAGARTAIAFDPSAPLIAPTAVVEPSTGLVDGQTVHLTGTGYQLDRETDVLQCSGVDTDAPTCTYLDFPDVAADGTIAIDLRLRAEIPGEGDAGPVDCRAPAADCELVIDHYAAHALIRLPLGFDPDAPLLPGPTLVVQPTAGIVDGQSVGVVASGFTPGDGIVVQFCSGSALRACDDRRQIDGVVGDDGTFVGRVVVDAVLRVTAESGAEAALDCRVAPGCLLVATDDEGMEATVALSYAPAGGGGSSPSGPSAPGGPGGAIGGAGPAVPISGHAGYAG